MAMAAYLVFFELVVARYAHSENHSIIFIVGSVVLFICYLGLIAIFMYQDCDVATKGSAYPAHMLTLPVRSVQLVLIPMGLGTIVVMVSGFLISKAIQGNYDPFPVIWPTFLMTAILAMLQAIFWYPIGVPYAKLVLTILGIPSILYFTAMILADSKSQTTVCQWLGIFTVICYAIAYHGVVRARRGDIQMFTISLPKNRIQRKRITHWSRFSDMFAAQRWYEWRQQGLVLPSLIGLLCLIFGYILSTDKLLGPAYEFSQSTTGLAPMVPSVLRVYSYLLLCLIPIVAWVVGCGARRSDVKHQDRTFYLFFGTRPMSDGALVAQKLRMALRSTLAAWGIVFVFVMYLLQTTGGVFDLKTQSPISKERTVYSLIVEFSSPSLIFWICSGFVILVAITWRNFAIGFWTELSGKTYLRYGYPIGVMLSITGFYTISALVVRWNPQFLATWNSILIIVWLIFPMRVFLSGFLISRQLRSGLLSKKCLRNGILGCALTFGVLCFISLAMTSQLRYELVVHGLSQAKSVALIIGLVILWTPIVRILLATEMLHRNRHRAS